MLFQLIRPLPQSDLLRITQMNVRIIVDSPQFNRTERGQSYSRFSYCLTAPECGQILPVPIQYSTVCRGSHRRHHLF